MIFPKWFANAFVFTFFLLISICGIAQQKSTPDLHYRINADADTIHHRINGRMEISIKINASTPDSLFIVCLPNISISSSDYSVLVNQQIENQDDLTLQRKRFSDNRKMQGIEIDNISAEPKISIGEQDEEGTFLYLKGIKSLKSDSLRINLSFRYYYPENKSVRMYGAIIATRWYPILLYTDPRKISFPFQSNEIFPKSFTNLSLNLPDGYFFVGSNGISAKYQQNVYSTVQNNGTFDFLASNNMMIDEYKLSNSKGLLVYNKKYISKIKNIKDIIVNYSSIFEKKTGLRTYIHPVVIGDFSEAIGNPESDFTMISATQLQNESSTKELLTYKMICQSLAYHEHGNLSETEITLLSELIYMLLTGKAYNSISGNKMLLLPLGDDSLKTQLALQTCVSNHSGFTGFLKSFLSPEQSSSLLSNTNYYLESDSSDFKVSKHGKRINFRTGRLGNVPLTYTIVKNDSLHRILIPVCPPEYSITDSGNIKRIIINPEKAYREWNYENNIWGAGKFRFLPFSLRKSDPYQKELRAFVFPSWNQASLIMATALISWNNQPKQRFGFTLIPTYSIKYHHPGGFGTMHFDVFRNNKDTLRWRCSGQHFLTGHINATINGISINEHFDYLRLSYAFQWLSGKKYLIEFKHHFQEVSQLYYTENNGTYLPQKIVSPQHFLNLSAQYHNHDIINPFRAEVSLSGNRNYAKIEAGISYRSFYDSKRFVQFSCRGGWIPAVKNDEYKNRYDLRLRFSDPLPCQDVFYETLMFDREAGSNDFLVRQTRHQNGGFYSWSPYGQSWKYLANLHFEFSVPVPIPLVFYGGMGISGNDATTGEKMNIAGESGVYVHFACEKIKVIFPILLSAKYREAANLNLNRYDQKIRISLEFDSDDIRKAFRF